MDVGDKLNLGIILDISDSRLVEVQEASQVLLDEFPLLLAPHRVADPFVVQIAVRKNFVDADLQVLVCHNKPVQFADRDMIAIQHESLGEQVSVVQEPIVKLLVDDVGAQEC